MELKTRRGTYRLPHFELWKQRGQVQAVADVLTPSSRVCVLGSCFAGQAARYLRRRGYNAWSHPAGEIYNPQFIRLELEHVLAGAPWPDDPALRLPDGWVHRFRRHYQAKTAEEIHTLDQAHTSEARDTLRSADIILVIVGTTTEIWRDTETGAPANEIPHPAIFHQGGWTLDLGNLGDLSVEIDRIQTILREHTAARQVYTVCPIPLNATWSPYPIIHANGRTKALLRVALDHALRDDSVYLDLWDWMQAQTGRWTPMQRDGRHLDERGVDEIMLFAEQRLGATSRLPLAHRLRSHAHDARQRLRATPLAEGPTP